MMAGRSADDWDGQMSFFLEHGYRVIAHDRRGHGRSSQTWVRNEMDAYAADVAALDLRDAIHVGHSTGGGEVARDAARHGTGRVAKAVLISVVPPVMVKSETNPGGTPIEVFDDIRRNTAFNRAQFYIDITLPFYGYNREGAPIIEGVRRNWWRQAMMGGLKAHDDSVKAFSETDDGEDDQTVPFANAGPLSAKLLRHSTFKAYPGFPHGMPTTHAETINADLLAFIRGRGQR